MGPEEGVVEIRVESRVEKGGMLLRFLSIATAV